jgi:outer membrane protein assembly factor BamB
MGYIGEDEVVWALDAATGKPVWKTPIAKANHDVGYNEGSRSTPTVDGAYIYLVGVSGDLVCLDRARGAIKWRKSLVKEFGGAIPGWGYTESPLIDGAKVIATPGGKDATLVALDKLTGNLIWKSQVPEGDPAHYSSCIQMTFGGVKQYVQFLKGGVVGVAAADGKFLWRYNHPANGTANISTPIYRDGTVFAASSYNTGGGLAKLTPSAGGFTAQEVYFTRQMKNHHGGMVLVGDYLYGFDENTLTCIKFATGDIAWTDRSVGKGSLTYVDGHLIARSERGPVALIEVNPQKYVEISRFEQPERSAANAWPHPVVANGRLYLRDQDLLLCYDVKGDAKPVQSAAK